MLLGSPLRSPPSGRSPRSSPGRSKLDIEATTWLARPSPGPRRLSSVRLHSLSTGCSSVAARASSTFGRTRRPRVANTPRTWQRLSLSAALRRDLSDASGPSPPLPFLRSRSVIEDMVTGWLRGHPRLPPTGSRAARPLRASRGVEDWLARRLRKRSFGPSTGRLRDARLATSPRVPQHPRSRLSWSTAPPPRRLARALAGPSPARPRAKPSDRSLVCISAAFAYGAPGSNLPSRAVGSS